MRVSDVPLIIALFACGSGFAGQKAPQNRPTSKPIPDARSAATQSAETASAQIPPASSSVLPPKEAATGEADTSGPVLVAATTADKEGTWTIKSGDVITDDDVEMMRTGVAINYLWSPTEVQPATDPSSCDSVCEAQARAEAGMSASPEAQWREQFEAARTDLAYDANWRAAYLDGLQKAHQYCLFRQQQDKNTSLSQGFQPASAREVFVSETDLALGRGMDSAAAQIQQQIQQAQRIDSVRAAMMEVLAERAFNQCPALPPR